MSFVHRGVNSPRIIVDYPQLTTLLVAKCLGKEVLVGFKKTGARVKGQSGLSFVFSHATCYVLLQPRSHGATECVPHGIKY